ncbi:dnaJ homolog subfamily C member 16 isoform X1 [Lingula anatina]|uniref:DnaJ homolog subfamily C member 16 isoform X1 n=2 Tax=Lingula anatina TaxID=7574 RepID=A0A1S3I960_LINAN|nr:dnaJ homolog subfamily C member 16 isoform X1 [Lingula anatina]|eukprot:XP_013393924.1 dnaJ homolog subfamily C member 16 isoform X1 [Lingula anatina]
MSLMLRIYMRLLDWADVVYHFIMSYDTVTLLSVAFSIIIIIIISFFTRLVTKFDEETKRQQQHQQQQQWGQEGYQPREVTVYLKELRAESYQDLVLRSPRGHVTVVLFLTEDTRQKLLQRFADIVLPYTRSKYFVFAFLRLEEYLPWYRLILEETIGQQARSLEMNSRNCIGTVLAINGFRKYYCMYHARTVRAFEKMNGQNGGNGEFMGFDSESESDAEDSVSDETEDPGVLFEKDLLDGLPNWLDRFVEGTLQRFKVDNWPPDMEP